MAISASLSTANKDGIKVAWFLIILIEILNLTMVSNLSDSLVVIDVLHHDGQEQECPVVSGYNDSILVLDFLLVCN